MWAHLLTGVLRHAGKAASAVAIASITVALLDSGDVGLDEIDTAALPWRSVTENFQVPPKHIFSKSEKHLLYSTRDLD